MYTFNNLKRKKGGQYGNCVRGHGVQIFASLWCRLGTLSLVRKESGVYPSMGISITSRGLVRHNLSTQAPSMTIMKITIIGSGNKCRRLTYHTVVFSIAYEVDCYGPPIFLIKDAFSSAVPRSSMHVFILGECHPITFSVASTWIIRYFYNSWKGYCPISRPQKPINILVWVSFSYFFPCLVTEK